MHQIPLVEGCPLCGRPIRDVPGGGEEHKPCWAYWTIQSDLRWLRDTYRSLTGLLAEITKLGSELVALEKQFTPEMMDQAEALKRRVEQLKRMLSKP